MPDPRCGKILPGSDTWTLHGTMQAGMHSMCVARPLGNPVHPDPSPPTWDAWDLHVAGMADNG